MVHDPNCDNFTTKPKDPKRTALLVPSFFPKMRPLGTGSGVRGKAERNIPKIDRLCYNSLSMSIKLQDFIIIFFFIIVNVVVVVIVIFIVVNLWRQITFINITIKYCAIYIHLFLISDFFIILFSC